MRSNREGPRFLGCVHALWKRARLVPLCSALGAGPGAGCCGLRTDHPSAIPQRSPPPPGSGPPGRRHQRQRVSGSGRHLPQPPAQPRAPRGHGAAGCAAAGQGLCMAAIRGRLGAAWLGLNGSGPGRGRAGWQPPGPVHGGQLAWACVHWLALTTTTAFQPTKPTKPNATHLAAAPPPLQSPSPQASGAAAVKASAAELGIVFDTDVDRWGRLRRGGWGLRVNFEPIP